MSDYSEITSLRSESYNVDRFKIKFNTNDGAISTLDNSVDSQSDYSEATLRQSESYKVARGKSNTDDGATSTLVDPQSEKRTALDWLRDISSVNHRSIQLETYAKLVPGTCSWILYDPSFQAWLAEESGALWGVGIPGAGKTILTSYVINYLQDRAATQEHDEIILFAYCRYKGDLTVSKIIAALLAQLSEKSMFVSSYVCETFHNLCIEQNPLHGLDVESVLIACIRAAVNLTSSKIYIAVDALDELRSDVREPLVNILLSLGRSMFLTSREIWISGSPFATLLHIRGPNRDFSTFVDHEVRNLPKLWALLEHRGDILADLVQNICVKSDGMFLLAVLQLSSIGDITSIEDLQRAYLALPSTLYDMYNVTLERILARTKVEHDLACHAILWVTYALRPLKVSELLEALAIDPDSTELNPDLLTSPQALISMCCGLLTIEQETGLVQLTHYTAADFFASQRFGVFKSPHNFLATICAQYLHLSGFSKHKIFTYQDLAVFSIARPLADYACRYLGYHVFHSSVENIDEIHPFVYDLLSNTSCIPLSHKCMATRSLNQHDIDYGHLIHFAALYGLQSIVTNSHKRFEERSPNGYTPILYAIIGGNTSTVKLMAEAGADVNAQNIQKETGLHLAAEQDHESIVTFLLSHPRVDPNAQDDHGYTPLHRASIKGHEPSTQLLLSHPKLDINKQDNQGYSALHHAAVNGSQPVIRHLLACPGINVNAQDAHKYTSLHRALVNGHEPIVRLLISCPEVDINTQDDHQCTPLHHACENGFATISQLLLFSPGIELNARDDCGYTGLHRAIVNGHESVVRLLLSTPGVDINAQDNQGYTPLHHASMNGHEALINLILSFSVVSSMQSSIVYAEDVATFLIKEEAEIIPKLNNGLSELGYNGPYYLQAGFNEELLCRNILHPEVFLHLDGNLECGDTIMSKVLSPIFAPQTTVLYTHSQVYNLIPPPDITRPHDAQDQLQSPVSTYRLNPSQQSQAIEMSQASQGSSQRSTGGSSRNGGDDSEGQLPGDERDGQQKRPLLEGVKENGTEDAANDYRRRLELQLDVPLTISTGLGSNGYVHEFGLKTNINVELRRNRDGNYCPEGLTSIQTPWSSVKFPNITISAGEALLYSFSALKVHVEATPKYTECNHLLPTTVGPTTDIKRSRDTRKKRTGGFTGGFMKGELKGEQSSEQGAGEELNIPIWSINPHHTKKWREKNAREVTVDYTYNGFERVRTQTFEPGPQAIFSYEPLQTGRTLRVFIRALWTLATDGLENRFSHIFEKLRDKVAGRDKPLIYANFFHKISFGINLEDLIPVGGDDDVLKGNNRRFDEDSFQDGHRVGNCDKPVFEPMPVHITLNGEESSVKIPLQRSVITAIHGGIKEGKRQVTSPDPDPFTLASH